MNARVEGNVVVVTVQCAGRPVAGAKLWLSFEPSSSLTESAVDTEKRDALLAAAPQGDPDAQRQASGKLKGVTNEIGEARFDLSNLQASARFSNPRARIDSWGEFESGSTSGGNNRWVFADLKNCTLFPTWQAQAEAQRGGGVDGARQLTKQLAATGETDKRDQVLAIAKVHCDRCLSQLPNSQCTGDGEVCFNVGSYFTKIPAPNVAVSDEKARLSGQYFGVSCKLGFQPACSRPEIAAAEAETKRMLAESAAASATRSEKEDEYATRLGRTCKGGSKVACGVYQMFVACRQGDARQCLAVGSLFHEGNSVAGLPSVPSKTEEYMNRACDGGAQEGCLAIQRWHLRRKPSVAPTGNAQATPQPQQPAAPTPRAEDSVQPPATGGARQSGPVQHCVQNPDNNCSNKKFYCDVTKENLEHPGTDSGDGHGGRICCWLHNHP